MTGGSNQRNSGPQSGGPWPTAAEEKERMYQQAQAKADKFQGGNPQVWSPPRQSTIDMGGSSNAMSPGKALYQSAMASIRNPVSPSGSQPASTTPLSPSGHYASAAEEKEAIRYQRALEAAKAKQGAGPIPYDALFPAASADIAPIHPLNITRSRSPPIEQEPPEQYNNLPPAPSPSADSRLIMNAKDEKERMRQLYEAQDNAARQPGGTSMAGGSLIPPQRPAGSSALPGRPTPGLPPAPAASRQLSAVEEKARLRAMYDNQDSTEQAGGASTARNPMSEDLPPVPPRPQTIYGNLQPNGFDGNGSSGASSAAPLDDLAGNSLEQRYNDRTPDYYHDESPDAEPASWKRPFGNQSAPPPPPPLPNKPPAGESWPG